MSKLVEDTYNGEMFICPTGQKYIISNTGFRKNFSMYLQSFDFAILAQSTINTLSKFKDSELVYHFHDGNGIAVTENEVKPFLAELSNQVEKTGKLIRLS
jgi:DNA polymerase III sliding clamp (beta) subunit (PCNA family)